MADEPCGNAGANGDLADGRSLEAEFRNAVQRRLDQFLAPLALGGAIKAAPVHRMPRAVPFSQIVIACEPLGSCVAPGEDRCCEERQKIDAGCYYTLE